MKKSSILGLQTDEELSVTLAQRFKTQRIYKNISQKELALKSNVNLSKIRRFEQEGKIQFLDLIKLLRAIGEKKMIEEFMDFESIIKSNANIDFLIEYENKPQRKRARK